MRKKLLFLGFAIPDEEMQEVLPFDERPAIQTHRFNWNVIRALEYHDAFDITYISSRPVSDYPLFPKKVIRSRRWKVELFEKEITIKEFPFINVGPLKIVSRFFSGAYYAIREYHSLANKGGIIVYSVHVPYMLIGHIVARLYKVDYIALWTDPPAVSLPSEKCWKKALRSIELSISRFLMKRVSRVIALTRFLAEDFAPGTPYLVMEGLIDESELRDNASDADGCRRHAPTRIVYAGTLSRKYGIENIVNGFLLAGDTGLLLEIYGRGDFEEDLEHICSSNSRIRYHGFIPHDAVLEIERNADFLINARSPSDVYVRYSFPSKTLEYMLSGTPLISTMLPGLPEEYREFVICLEDNNPHTISAVLERVTRWTKEERRQFGLRAQKFAMSKNYVDQGKRMVDFINDT